MNLHLRKFSIYLFVLTLMVSVSGWILYKKYLPEMFFRGFLFVPAFFFMITMAVHYYLVRSGRKPAIKFTPRYLGATGIKMLIYIIILFTYILIDREHAVSFLICFLVCYLLFTLFEIISVLKYLRNDQQVIKN